MNAESVTIVVGMVLAAAVTGLWLLQQHQRGHTRRARALAAAIALMAVTGTAVADEADLDETTRLVDLGRIVPPPMWRVEAGDHYWRIATATVASRRERGTDRHVEPYWRSLVSFNQAHRGGPRHPDLLHVGELVWLPEPD